MAEPKGPMITTQEVAEMVGVCHGTVTRWCRNGQIPASQIGRSWRLDRTEVQRWLAAKRKQLRLPGEDAQEQGADGQLTAKQAAAALNVSYRTVQRHADDLQGRKVDGRWMFPREMVELAKHKGLPLPKGERPEMWRGPERLPVGKVTVGGELIPPGQTVIFPMHMDERVSEYAKLQFEMHELARSRRELAEQTRKCERAEERLWAFYQKVARAMGLNILEMGAEMNIEEALLSSIGAQTGALQKAIDTALRIGVK